jgi:hypothetical protein
MGRAALMIVKQLVEAGERGFVGAAWRRMLRPHCLVANCTMADEPRIATERLRRRFSNPRDKHDGYDTSTHMHGYAPSRGCDESLYLVPIIVEVRTEQRTTRGGTISGGVDAVTIGRKTQPELQAGSSGCHTDARGQPQEPPTQTPR